MARPASCDPKTVCPSRFVGTLYSTVVRGSGLAFITATLSYVADPAAARSVSVQCGASAVTVTAPRREEAEAACVAATDAIAFLEENGLRLGKRFEVRLVQIVPGDRGSADLFGCYNHQNSSVHVLIFSQCQGVRGPFGLEMDRVLHKSVIGHEVAHAVAAHNFTVDRPSLVAQEYIAYVTQLAVLPADVRVKILGRFPSDILSPDAASNLMLLAVDPGRFAAVAYRHYVHPGNGAPFIHRVLSGDVLASDVDVK